MTHDQQFLLDLEFLRTLVSKERLTCDDSGRLWEVTERLARYRDQVLENTIPF